MHGQVRSALMYPVCVLSVLGLAVVFLVGVVLPRFAGMFQSRGVPLPFSTRAMLGAGLSLQSYWFIYLPVAAALIVGVRLILRRPRAKRVLEGFLHRVPQIGQILRGLALARFARVLGLSISSGLGLIEALELAGNASGRA